MNPEENYITYSLSAIILAVSLYALIDNRVFDRLILHPASVIHKKEYYRILTSALVHNNFLHLGLNLLMLYVYCSGLEESDSGLQLTLLLIIVNSLLAGHLMSLIVYRKNIKYSCAGASGIAIGCMCGYLILHPLKNHVSLPFMGTIPNIYSAAAYLAILLIYNRRFNDGKIDYGVHIGGGLGGSITSILMHPAVITNIL